MFKFFKNWYDSHLTDPNQASLAFIILFVSIILYILLATVVPILVAIVLAYMLEGLVHRIQERSQLNRNIIVLLVYFFFPYTFNRSVIYASSNHVRTAYAIH